MLLVLFLAWFIIFWSMMNGSETAGAKLYFIAFIPYIVLVIFLITGLMQDGGAEGFRVRFFEFLLIFQWQTFKNFSKLLFSKTESHTFSNRINGRWGF